MRAMVRVRHLIDPLRFASSKQNRRRWRRAADIASDEMGGGRPPAAPGGASCWAPNVSSIEEIGRVEACKDPVWTERATLSGQTRQAAG